MVNSWVWLEGAVRGGTQRHFPGEDVTWRPSSQRWDVHGRQAGRAGGSTKTWWSFSAWTGVKFHNVWTFILMNLRKSVSVTGECLTAAARRRCAAVGLPYAPAAPCSSFKAETKVSSAVFHLGSVSTAGDGSPSLNEFVSPALPRPRVSPCCKFVIVVCQI